MSDINNDFPIGFAETKNYEVADNTVFYVEWLDNNNEFPDLTITKPTSSLDEDHWELLQRKEMDYDDMLLDDVTGDNWSKINSFKTNSYSDIATKNMEVLASRKREMKSYPITKKKPVERIEIIEDNTDDYDLFYNIYNSYKGQSKTAARKSNLKFQHQKELSKIRSPWLYSIITSVLNPYTERYELNEIKVESDLLNLTKDQALRRLSKINGKSEIKDDTLKGRKMVGFEHSLYAATYKVTRK